MAALRPAPRLPDPIPVKLTVSGKEAQGSFEFEGTGIGADLTIAFESTVGLTRSCSAGSPSREWASRWASPS